MRPRRLELEVDMRPSVMLNDGKYAHVHPTLGKNK